MKGILQFIFIVACGCSTAHSAKNIPNKENEAMKTIQNITWIFKGENIDLFNGSDTPLNKDYEFINEKNIKFDSAKIHPSHGAPQGLIGFTLILCSDKAAFPEVVSGRRKEEFPAELICLEFFENGQFTAQKIVSPYAAPDGSRETFNEIFYENGSIAEERVYHMRNGKCMIHRKRIDGELVELFNRDAGIDRLTEFGEDGD